jgi:hypothetical protein
MDTLSFEQAEIIPSRQFLTQQYSVPTRDGLDYMYTPSSSAMIDISGMAMNSFVIPSTLRLCYHAVHNVQTSNTGVAVPDVGDAPPLYGEPSLQQCPAIPFYGAPHLGSVTCDVPSLSSDGFSLLSADSKSQPFYISRLLCSGNEGYMSVPSSKATFGQRGQAKMAGGRTLAERASSVCGSLWKADRNDAGVGTVVRDTLKGGWMRYEVPGSAFFALANTGSLLPLSYLTGSSTNLSIRVNWADARNAMNVSSYGNSFAAATYVVGGVSLEYSSVLVLDPIVLNALQSLFRGEVSQPLAGISVPVPMTLAYKRFNFGSAALSSPSGSVTMRIPASAACCDCLMVKIDALTVASDADQGANKYFQSVRPILSDISLRIGSSVFPARQTQDIFYETSQVVRGLGTSKWLLNVPATADVLNAQIGLGATSIPTASSKFADLYRQGRRAFSFYQDDDMSATPAGELYDPGHGMQKLGVNEKMKISGAPGGGSILYQAGVAQGVTSDPYEEGLTWYRNVQAPNMYLFPLSSFLPDDSPKALSSTFTGLDLRSLADIELSFQIRASDVCNQNQLEPAGEKPVVQSWLAAATLSISELLTVLPSRTNTRASASAIPSSSSVTASAGTMR